MKRMTCILIAGIPAVGKSTVARELSRRLNMPFFSKDDLKEILFDRIGFDSRQAKVQLGEAAADVLWDCAERLMRFGLPLILENNFEDASREAVLKLLEKYGYRGLTLMLTGDHRMLYERFCMRNISPERHRGHVVNDYYPEIVPHTVEQLRAATLSFEAYETGIARRGMERFHANAPVLRVDTTDLAAVDMDAIEHWIRGQMAQA